MKFAGEVLFGILRCFSKLGIVYFSHHEGYVIHGRALKIKFLHKVTLGIRFRKKFVSKIAPKFPNNAIKRVN